jgi:hypothetical protein
MKTMETLLGSMEPMETPLGSMKTMGGNPETPPGSATGTGGGGGGGGGFRAISLVHLRASPVAHALKPFGSPGVSSEANLFCCPNFTPLSTSELKLLQNANSADCSDLAKRVNISTVVYKEALCGREQYTGW